MHRNTEILFSFENWRKINYYFITVNFTSYKILAFQ